MLIFLLPLIWLAVTVLTVTACRVAAHADTSLQRPTNDL